MSSASDYLNALPANYRLQEFELLSVLGAGGFGITYMGMDHLLNKMVAIKEYLPNDFAVRRDHESVLPKSTADKDNFAWGLDRFLDEARVLARFDHPNIIRVHRYFESNGTAYIVMDYAEGATLDDRLKSKRTLKLGELNDILLPILDGLEVVHRANFLHRDLKPSNIIIRKDGTPIILDFGAARQAVSAKSRSVTAIVTPGYAPIEQYSTKGNQGPWTDIYALAAIAYRCIVGARPADATERVYDDPLVGWVDNRRGWARPFLQAVDGALAFKEKDRPQSIDEWRKLLIKGQEEVSDGSQPATAKERNLGAQRLKSVKVPSFAPVWNLVQRTGAHLRRIAFPGRQRFFEKSLRQILLDSYRKSKAHGFRALLAAKQVAEKPALLWATMVMLTITSVMLAVVYFRPMMDSARIDSREQISIPSMEQPPPNPVDISLPPSGTSLTSSDVEEIFQEIGKLQSSEDKKRWQEAFAQQIVDDLTRRVSQSAPAEPELYELKEILRISKDNLDATAVMVMAVIDESVGAASAFQRSLDERQAPETRNLSGQRVLDDWAELLKNLDFVFKLKPYSWQAERWNKELGKLFNSIANELEAAYEESIESELDGASIEELLESVRNLLDRARDVWQQIINQDNRDFAKDLEERLGAIPSLESSAENIKIDRFRIAMRDYIGPLQRDYSENGWVEAKISRQLQDIGRGYLRRAGKALEKNSTEGVAGAKMYLDSFRNLELDRADFSKQIASLEKLIAQTENKSKQDEQQRLAERAKAVPDSDRWIVDTEKQVRMRVHMNDENCAWLWVNAHCSKSARDYFEREHQHGAHKNFLSRLKGECNRRAGDPGSKIHTFNLQSLAISRGATGVSLNELHQSLCPD